MIRRQGRFFRLSIGLIVLLMSATWAGTPLGMSGVAYAAGFIDFEGGSDSAPIQSTIPGLQFTTTDGQDWIYGDWRSGGYNGPFPTGSYYSNGNFFAWLGVSQGDGRIDFTQGDATFITMQVSTLNSVTLRGYDAANNVVAESTFSGGNLNTGRMDTLSITAPGGKAFRYVIVSGAANYWLIDDLSTDAKGVPGNPPAPRPEREQRVVDPALITITEQTSPSAMASRSPVDFGLFGNADNGIVRGTGFGTFATPPASIGDDGIINYTFTVTNRGAGDAKDVLATLPFDGAALRLLDATFSTTAAYVSSINKEAPSLTFHTGPIAPNASVIATVRMLVRPGTPDGTSLSQRVWFNWLDGKSGGEGASNQPVVVAGGADADLMYYPIEVTPADAAASELRFVKSTVFIPNESVSLWYNTPIGTAVGLGTVTADSSGSINITLDTNGVASGAYSIVAVGAWSQFTAVAPFSITP